MANFYKNQFYTIPEMAEMLGISYKTVFRYIHDKRVKAVKIGRWLIAKKDVEKFIKENTNLKD